MQKFLHAHCFFITQPFYKNDSDKLSREEMFRAVGSEPKTQIAEKRGWVLLRGTSVAESS